MKRFTDLFIALDQTNKTSEKEAAIEAYFRAADDADAAWALALLMGHRIKRLVKHSVVADAAMRASTLPAWMIDECHSAVGDFSETIALAIPDSADTLDEPLARVMQDRVLPLARMKPEDAGQLLTDSWSRMSSRQRLVFNKLVRGNFRLGVQKKLAIRALARVAEIDAGVLEHRLSGTFKPTPEAYRAAIAGGSTPDDAARPYPFCLAYQLDASPEDLGDVHLWQVEHKWDGIRAQIVRREGMGRAVLIWSRGEELVTDTFPEIVSAAERLPAGTVLDGELLAWRFQPSPGRALSFNALQQRLNRKGVQPGLFDIEGVAFVAFDVLEHSGSDLRERPLAERRHLLESTLTPLERSTGGVLRVAPVLKTDSWSQVAALRAEARDRHGAEGVMLKHVGSRYHVGRVTGGTGAAAKDALDVGWWKWKVDPFAVDAVLIAAQPGSGRRAGLYTDYTFGVWDPDPTGELTPFAKAYSGLDADEIAKVDRYVREHTTARAGPVRLVEPGLVFEIAFEGIQSSTRHRSGIAVRFPRIARWRTDKLPKDADTIAMVRSLLEAERRRDAASG